MKGLHCVKNLIIIRKNSSQDIYVNADKAGRRWGELCADCKINRSS